MLVQLKFDTEKEDVEDLKKLYKWVGDLLLKRGVGVEPIVQSAPVMQSSQVPSSQELKDKQEASKQPSRTAGGSRFVQYDDKVEDMMSSLLCKQNTRR